jgi:nitrile hydratase
MDGVHDLGGRRGFDKVEVEANEPVFHYRWEAKVFAMSGAGFLAGGWHYTDQFRHAIERIDPAAYLTHGYYGRWLGGIETLLVEAGIVRQDEITRRALDLGASANDLIAARPDPNPDPLGDRPGVTETPREIDRPPKYQVGDHITTTTEVKTRHTRLPAYARGKPGRVVHWHDAWVYPDTAAHGQGEQPQHLYTIEFSGTDLWGTDSDPALKVHLDLFEPYLSLNSIQQGVEE